MSLPPIFPEDPPPGTKDEMTVEEFWRRETELSLLSRGEIHPRSIYLLYLDIRESEKRIISGFPPGTVVTFKKGRKLKFATRNMEIFKQRMRDELTFDAIAKLNKISRERVRQIVCKIERSMIAYDEDGKRIKHFGRGEDERPASNPLDAGIYSAPEMAVLLNRSLANVYLMTRRNRKNPLPCFYVGRFIRFRHDEIMQWIERGGKVRSDALLKKWIEWKKDLDAE